MLFSGLTGSLRFNLIFIYVVLDTVEGEMGVAAVQVEGGSSHNPAKNRQTLISRYLHM